MTRTSKTPKELGMTVEEYGALIGVRGLLATGALKHAEQTSKIKEGQYGFNMAHWRFRPWAGHCGTAMCIGGAMGWLMGDPCFDAAHGSKLRSLFYPDVASFGTWTDNARNWTRITPAQAVKAIDNFLTTGKPHWNEVLSND